MTLGEKSGIVNNRRRFTFNSEAQLGEKLPHFPQDVVKNEPGLFSASVDFAHAVGGPITRAFLRAAIKRIGLRAESAIFDSRVHMLMPGWYPAIPGWHHDDVPRTRADGQPDYETLPYRSQHVMALVNGDIAPTEFATGIFVMRDVYRGEGPIYRHWHMAVETQLADENIETRRWSAPSNQLLFFDWQTFHRGVKATGSGFRWFGRLSWDTHRPHLNEVRSQSQVYLEFPTEGW